MELEAARWRDDDVDRGEEGVGWWGPEMIVDSPSLSTSIVQPGRPCWLYSLF
jgi:hypothetical protein